MSLTFDFAPYVANELADYEADTEQEFTAEVRTTADLTYIGATSGEIFASDTLRAVSKALASVLADYYVLPSCGYLALAHSSGGMLSTGRAPSLVLGHARENGRWTSSNRNEGNLAALLAGIASPKKYGATWDKESREWAFPSSKHFFRWVLGAMDVDEKAPEVQKAMKDLVNATKAKTYHVYTATDAFPELAAGLNGFTKARSCMAKEGLSSTIQHFPNIFGRTDGEGQREGVHWLHPFHAYEHPDTNQKMILVSEHAPEKLAGKAWDCVPFIARAFVDSDGYYARGYGQESVMEKIRDFLACNGFTKGDVKFKIRAWRSTDWENVAPYVDQYYGTSNVLIPCGSGFDERGDYDDYVQGDNEQDAYNDARAEGYDCAYEVDHHTGFVVRAEVPSVYCAIEEEYITLEEAVYISDWDCYVGEQYTDGDGNLDGNALFRYFRG